MENNDYCSDTKAGYVPLLLLSQEVVSPDLQERRSSLVQVKPEPLHIKGEQEDVLLQSPVDADGSSFTLHGVIDGSGCLRLENAEFLHLPVCKEESCPEDERNSSLVKEVPELPQIKEEQEELPQRPEDGDGSTLTLLAVKSEDCDENRETEPLASTLTRRTKTQVVRDCGGSHPTSHDRSSNSSKSDTVDSDENWEKTTEGLSVVNTWKSRKKRPQDSQTTQMAGDHTSSHLSESDTEHSKFCFKCTFCRRCFGTRAALGQHLSSSHSGQKPFSCTHCDRSFASKAGMNRHMHMHTKENPYLYSYKYLSVD